MRELEGRCIQEEWAWCRAACPLHVDARGLCLALAEGDTAKARSLLEKTMPIADILGRICEAPCEARCKRGEAGGAIRIGRLERHLVSRAPRRSKPLKVPDRGRSAVVVGCGISSLTAAHDLARKGYRITLYYPDTEADPKTALSRHLPRPLPGEVLSGEISFLQKLGVTFTPAAFDSKLLSGILEKGSLVYAGLDAMPAAILPSEPGQRDPRTLAAPEAGLFIGGMPDAESGISAIEAAGEGRRAAVSIDRLTQKASLTADRGPEGPVETRLVTRLEGVTSEPPVLPAEEAGEGKTDDPAAVQKEAARCLACECMICVRNCPYLEAFGSYPKQYARQIYNNEAIVKGSRQANTLINSCMLCGLCTTLCPHDFPMAELCRGARERMAESGHMPPSAHDFALKDLEFSGSADFFMLRPDPDPDPETHPAPGKSDWLFFPGCQLCATHPEAVADAYAWLRQKLPGGVGLALACCGAPAHWAGRTERFGETAARLAEKAAELGRPRWIVACPSCQHLISRMTPAPEQTSLWELLAQEKDPLSASAPSSGKWSGKCLVDPCAASFLPDVRQAVRALAGRLTADFTEPCLNATEAACCGYGGLVANASPEIAERAAARRSNDCPDDSLTYCAMCRDQIARSGGRSAHMLELIFRQEEKDPFDHPPTGLSESRWNRRWLKGHLLASLWDESQSPAPDYADIVLDVPIETRALLERRRILDTDIQQVLDGVESHGQLFYDAESGAYLASRRLGEVTFWVHYAPAEDNRYRIHTAWSHRMGIGKIITGTN